MPVGSVEGEWAVGAQVGMVGSDGPAAFVDLAVVVAAEQESVGQV